MSIVRPRRSALYVPGSNQRAIDKAASLDVDVVIFDLEDAVSPSEKELARDQVAAAMDARERFGTKELVVRINGSETPWYERDVRSCLASVPDAVLLPKVERAEQIAALAESIGSSKDAGPVSLWAMLETPRGVLRAESIAGAHDWLACLVMGTSDLTNDLRALHTPDRLPLLTSLGLCVLAARAYGKVVLDGVSLDLSNPDAFRLSCRQGRELGFDGKTLIHPRQIASCNSAFSPTESEVERASAIITAFSAARAEGRGVTVLDGRLIEEMHVREAERTLALAAAISARKVLSVESPTS